MSLYITSTNSSPIAASPTRRMYSRVRMLNGLPAVVVTVGDGLRGVAPRFALSVEVGGDGRIVAVRSVLASRKNKGAQAYRELAGSLLKHWKNGKELATFTPEI